MSKKAIPRESTDQTKLVARIKMHYPAVVVFAIPNGGFRNSKEAARLKAEGVLAGVPDLMVAVARNGRNGLFIEMKREKGGRVSPAQRAVIEDLEGAGYSVAIGRGVDDAWLAFLEYMGAYT